MSDQEPTIFDALMNLAQAGPAYVSQLKHQFKRTTAEAKAKTCLGVAVVDTEGCVVFQLRADLGWPIGLLFGFHGSRWMACPLEADWTDEEVTKHAQDLANHLDKLEEKL